MAKAIVHSLEFLSSLSELFDYNPNTGVILWSKKAYINVVGRVAGSADGRGYLKIQCRRKCILAHRLAWFLFYKEWPDQNMQIDHINGNTSDNRIRNLRVVTHSKNQQNMKVHRKGRPIGVRKVKGYNRWYATLPRVVGKNRFKKNKHLGFFGSEKEAADVVKKEIKKLGGYI